MCYNIKRFSLTWKMKGHFWGQGIKQEHTRNLQARLVGVFISISLLASQGNEHTVKFMLKRKVMLHCTEKATLETESSRKNSKQVQLKMGFHSCFLTTFFYIFATFPGEDVTNTTAYLINNYPFFPWVSIIILIMYFGLEHGLPYIRAQKRARDEMFLLSFCWLPAVGLIARKEPPWMAAGSSACMDRNGHLLMFPCLSAPSERSNINPQPQFPSFWSALWTTRCCIWFTHKPVAQAEPRSPELSPKASRDPCCTTLWDRGGGKAERQQ